jgi:hypothetical protein
MKLRFTPRAARDLVLASFVCLWTCASIAADAATAGAAPSDSKNEVTLRGDDALKLLVGNTLRSVGDKKLVPEYRYFMNERFEYRCDGWDPVNVKPSEMIGGSIFVNRWRIENGELCRTENDEPAKFFCHMSSVLLQKPNDPGNQAAPRFCVGRSSIGDGFIAKGNPFAIDFSRATGK